MSDYEMKTEYRDVDEVADQLGLSGYPIGVTLTGRAVGFKIPLYNNEQD